MLPARSGHFTMGAVMPKCCGAGLALIVACCVSGAGALAQGRTLKQRILANPQGEIGPAISMVAAAERASPRERQGGGEIAINWCHIYGTWHGSRDDHFLDHFQHVAEHYVLLRGQLQAGGYPAEVVRPDLNAIVSAYLAELQRRHTSGLDLKDIAGIKRAILPFEQRLGARMNAYRQQYDRTAPRPEVWQQCGGDYMGFVKVRTRPADGSVRLIRDFYYKLCQKTGIHPLSNQCDKWSLVTSSREIPGGIYYYVVNWPNGRTECDRIEFDGATPEQDEKIVTIAQSGRDCAR
jgi:hypothetical protein